MNEKMVTPVQNTINGRKTRQSDTPADLKDTSSYFSDRLPIDITAASNTPMGNAIGNSDTDIYPIISVMTSIPAPLPAISSIHSHTSCIRNTKTDMLKAIRKGGQKALISSLSTFFIYRVKRKDRSIVVERGVRERLRMMTTLRSQFGTLLG